MQTLDEFLRHAIHERVQALDLALAAFEERADDTELRSIAHSLRGAGASFGLPQVSSLAAAVERAPVEQLRGAVEDLQRALDGASADTDRKTVLLVDDDPLISSLLEMRLAGLDRRVVTASTIEQARDLVTELEPTVVVLDLVLNDGDGRTLLAELKSQPETAGTPVIMMSGSDAVGLRDHCVALGADAFITKPFDTDAAVHTIARFLQVGASAGIEKLVDLYDRAIASVGTDVTIATVIPESHGSPARTDSTIDEAIITDVQLVLDLFVTAPGRWVRSGVAEFTVVTPLRVEETADLLDRARLRLRTRRHPTNPNALMTLSAGIARSETGTDLADTLSHARALAASANQTGGDRVSSELRGGGGRRVLLAEDDALTAALVIKRLEREGYDVEHHPNGTDAMAAFARGSFSLVVLDVNMPQANGFEVLQTIRSSGDTSTVPVVMLTAAGSERDVVRGFELGADDYILKPFSPAELGARLRRFTRRI